MPDYAYVRATAQGPWHIVQLGYPGAIYDQPLCGIVLCYETWSTEPITEEISHEAKVPLCESCQIAYSGLVYLKTTPSTTEEKPEPACYLCEDVGYLQRLTDKSRVKCPCQGADIPFAEILRKALSTCLREIEIAGALDKAQADFLLSLVNVISDKLARARDERDDAVRMLEESERKLGDALKSLEKRA